MKKRGFSIIEFIVVMAILGILSGICIPLVMQSVEAYLYHSKRAEELESAVIAVGRMTREIRRIRDTSSVVTATSSSFGFIDSSSNTITFSLSGSTLMRTFGGTLNGLADNVTALTFTYYDASGTVLPSPTLNPTNIRRIQIDLTFTLSSSQLNFRSQVSPRRLQ
jgi:prepilin-type N-terminal cleavage/methylation domain-containing protein